MTTLQINTAVYVFSDADYQAFKRKIEQCLHWAASADDAAARIADELQRAGENGRKSIFQRSTNDHSETGVTILKAILVYYGLE